MERYSTFDQIFEEGSFTTSETLVSNLGDISCAEIIRAKLLSDKVPIIDVINFGLAHFILCECLEISEYSTPERILAETKVRVSSKNVNKNIVTLETVASYSRPLVKIMYLKLMKKEIKSNMNFNYFRLSNSAENLGLLIPERFSIANLDDVYKRVLTLFMRMNINLKIINTAVIVESIWKAMEIFESEFKNEMGNYKPGSKGVKKPMCIDKLPRCAPAYMYVGAYLNPEPLMPKALNGQMISKMDQILTGQSKFLTYTILKIGSGWDMQNCGAFITQMHIIIAHGGTQENWGELDHYGASFESVNEKVFENNNPCGLISLMGKFLRVIELKLTTARTYTNVGLFAKKMPSVVTLRLDDECYG